MIDKVKLMIATAGGLGLSPYYPGSCAALSGVAMHLAVFHLLSPEWHVPLLLGIFLIVVLANHWLTPWAESYWQEPDSRHFVLDEVAGYLVVPLLFHKGQPWQVALAGFLLFRTFDVIKIPPAKQIDLTMKNSLGVVLDDVVSAVYAVVVMYASYYLWRIV